MITFIGKYRFFNFRSSNTFYYDLPAVRSMRSTSLGKGDKFDFTKENKGKNAQFYNMPTDFDPNKPHTPSWTFGISRGYYDKVYYETNKMLDKNVYLEVLKIKNITIEFSMKNYLINRQKIKIFGKKIFHRFFS